MLIPTTLEDYAQTLIERFNSMRRVVGDQRLQRIFSGAKASIPPLGLGEKVTNEVLEAYRIAEARLFPPAQ